MSLFDGMCALVTGSATGLGAATAIGLARGGARVVVNYRSSAREAEETADLCRAANAVVKLVQADVASDEDCRRLAAAASEWGRLNTLVNNASATKHVANPADLDALSAEDFQRLYAVNTIGPFQMIRAARSLLEAGARAAGHPSSVVNVSSVAALNGTGSSIAYVASKSALNAMTLSLARACPADSGERALPGLHGHAVVDERCGSRGGRQASRDRQVGGPVAGGLQARGHGRGGHVPRRARLASRDRNNHSGRCGAASAGSRRCDGRPALTVSPGPPHRSLRPTRPGLWLVHRRLRHPRSQEAKGVLDSLIIA